MIEFEKEKLDYFLSVIRKYMQLRGGLNQKDLSDLTNIGISTMSRFLSKKTNQLDAQLIAKLVAKLEIPLHEVIDFVMEESTARFKKLVQFYKDEEYADKTDENKTQKIIMEDADEVSEDDIDDDDFESSMADVFETDLKTQANVNIGGRTTSIPFGGENKKDGPEFKEKLKGLSMRQKAFVANFLDIDNEGRDVIVDVSNQLLSYFKQRRVQF